jgi:hypothetical protein
MVPDCDSAPPEVMATTMFNETTAGETSKRMLAMDDQNGVCDTYPPALDPMICNINLPDDTFGCATRPGRAHSSELAATLIFLTAAVAVSRRRARPRR